MKCVICARYGREGFAYFDIDGDPVCIPCFLREPIDPLPDYLLKNKKFRNTPIHKRGAHRLVSLAKKTGHLKEQPCEVCGKTYGIEAHHEDYSKPLEVHWLCVKHHAAVTHGDLSL